MHLRRVHIRNLRSIDELEWRLPEDARGPGWHVVLGDNGSGKSTFLQAIAIALIGPQQLPALRQSWHGWLRRDEDEAIVDLDLCPVDPSSLRPVGVRLARAQSEGESEEEVVELSASPTSEPYSHTRNSGNIWGPWVAGGWFSASYGPFRRFSGGDPAQEELFTSNPKLARHLSLFGEAVALTEALRWLQSLRFAQLEDVDSAESKLLEQVKTLINQPGFLPNDARLHDVSSKKVTFLDGNGVEVPIQDLSDGYRSILSMTLELIRQLSLWAPADHVFTADGGMVQSAGTVLIDEIDAHLHPTWQRTIGHWFLRYFPNLQFIVTTHSPLICQAAERGSVYVLPRQGTEEQGQMVEGVALSRLLYGDVMDAYSTGVFGDGVTRSVAAQEKLQRLAELNAAEAARPLDPAEQREHTGVRNTRSSA
jgi:energy-coupling factor transporter ATP-binding protein EcfA2